MSVDSEERGRWPPTRAITVVTVAVLVIGTLAVGATVPWDRQGPPVAAQQSGGFPGTVDASQADTTFTAEAANATAGWSVANAGDVNGDGFDDVIVGAPRNDSAAGNDSGAAYVFFGPVESDDIDLSSADVTLSGEAETDWAGWDVSPAGDLDGDGVDDVLISAPLNDANGYQSGAVYVVLGGTWLPESTSLADANATLHGGADDRAGWSVSNVSETATGDPGVLVGALTDDDGGADAGATFLVGASSITRRTFLDAGSDAKFVGENAGDGAGIAVSAPGDVDGDGTTDVLVGARHNDGNGNDSGAAYLVSSNLTGTVDLADANVTMRGAAPLDEAGYAVSGAGDVNDDGDPDVLVGAPSNDSAATDAGAAYVVYGSDSLPATIDLSDANVTLTGLGEGDSAGWSVARARSGDVTCDGVDDVLVGAPWYDTSGSNAGAAYLVAGDESLSGTLSLAEADTTFFGDSSGDRFGYSLGSAGDQREDGFGDVLIGAPYNESAGVDAGEAYLFDVDCPTPEEPSPEPTEVPPTTEEPPTTPTETPPITTTEIPTTVAPPTTTEEPPNTTTEAPPTTEFPPSTPTDEPPITTEETPPTQTEEPSPDTTEAPPPTMTEAPPPTEETSQTTTAGSV